MYEKRPIYIHEKRPMFMQRDLNTCKKGPTRMKRKLHV